MKVILICSIFLLCWVKADLLTFQSKLQASDAMDSVLDLLTNLKEANLQQQQQHNQLNQTESEFGRELISRLQEVYETIEKSFEDVQEHQKKLKAQLEEVTSYLDWIAQRKIDIDKRLYNYHEMRCYSNEMFVKALKENKEAIHVLDLLLDDLNAYKESGGISFAQAKDFTGKISLYSHLFNQQAYNSFIALGLLKFLLILHQKQGIHNEEPIQEEGLGNKLLNTASKLKSEVIENLKNLEENEIQSAYDYADYMMHEEYEHKRLNIQNERKSKFQRALEMDIELEETTISSTERALKDSEKELTYAREDLQRRGEYFVQETERRNNDNMLIQEIMGMIESKVSAFAQLK